MLPIGTRFAHWAQPHKECILKRTAPKKERPRRRYLLPTPRLRRIGHTARLPPHGPKTTTRKVKKPKALRRSDRSRHSQDKKKHEPKKEDVNEL